MPALAVVHTNIRVCIKLRRAVGVVCGIHAHLIAVSHTINRLNECPVLVKEIDIERTSDASEIALKDVLVFLRIVIRVG